MVDEKLLNQTIKESGISKTHIAKQLGISRTALYDKIGNRAQLTYTDAIVLCDVLRITNFDDMRKILG